MAVTNRDRVGRAMDALQAALVPFVEREMDARAGKEWRKWLDYERDRKMPRRADGGIAWDVQGLLHSMVGSWKDVFGKTLSQGHRSLVGELIDVRNDWAHQKPFSADDAHRALDTTQRLLTAISAAKEAGEVEAMRQELMRTVYSDQARQQGRRQAVLIEARPEAGLKPWREVVTPHADVASGRYTQAEFAADLAQVARGEGTTEYRDPIEFYRRTYLTDGLKKLLTGAINRLASKGGDPVVELQTNFGGGKTHSLLALFHLASGKKLAELPGLEALAREAGLPPLPTKLTRAVFVGQAVSPGTPQKKPDGTVVRTMWGDLAWQLARAPGVALVADADRTGTNPGSDALVALFRKAAPCLILIDEWLTFIRQLWQESGLPAGSFDANVTFAQALTEAARAVPGVVLVASLPESDIEVGGEGGREALRRLQNVFARLESPWRAASIEESFEIVRRRLFEPIRENAHFAARDLVIDNFARLYRQNVAEFPAGVGEADYRRRMTEAYPIHPELFEKLYYAWGSLERFQRTRGVLRLMAAVIHVLWERRDPSLLILPSSVPLDEPAVVSELTRYMPQGWDAVIGKDVDGPHSLPLDIDRANQNFGRYSAARRVTRTIYMGSAPVADQGNAGIDDRAIKLGCVQPGETVGTFGDALRRLTDQATFLYVDSGRYWFMTKPSVSRMADDRAAQIEHDTVLAAVIDRLARDAARGDFAGVHPAPTSSADVPDEMAARLVVIGPAHPHRARDAESPARHFAQEVLINRGTSPRLYRNMLVFLAPDAQRLEELEKAVRKLLAWRSIVADKERLELVTSQVKHAETQAEREEETVKARMKETWSHLLTPVQPDPVGPTEWEEARLHGQDPIAVRASKKLLSDEHLITRLGPARLRINLDKVHWGNANHVGTAKLWEYLASYVYLSRIKDRTVLQRAIEDGLRQLTCDHFAYAEAFDEATGRYRGIVAGASAAPVMLDSLSVLVKPEVARPQAPGPEPTPSPHPQGPSPVPPGGGPVPQADPSRPRLPRRFYGSVELSADRLGRDAGRIAEEVVQRLRDLPGARLTITLDIQAEVVGGFPDEVRRVVSENCGALKFRERGFADS